MMDHKELYSMSKIIQFSTIGTLMSGYCRGERYLSDICCCKTFGLGCSEEINGELTIYEGITYEATAGEALHKLTEQTMVPFLQITAFNPQNIYSVSDITHKNAYEILSQFIQLDNIFLAVSVEGMFDHLMIRRPHRIKAGNRDIHQITNTQKVDKHKMLEGRLIGFWTPELYGRISVPGFHFHFIDKSKKISGHVLEFHAQQASLAFEEKETIEITNPTSTLYKKIKIDIDQLDDIINRVEKS